MKKVVIIGGGVVGLCSAWYCRKAGHDVTLLERGPANQNGCSFGNAGLIVPSHIIPLASPGMASKAFKMMWDAESPFYVKPRISTELFDWGIKFLRACTEEHVRQSAPLLRDLNLASKRLFEEFDALPEMAFGFTKRGLLTLCQTARTLREELALANRAKALGMGVEVLNPDETRQLDPGITLNCCGSVYFPDDAHLSPQQFMEQLRSLLQTRGVHLRWESEVIGWNRHANRVEGVVTPQGTVRGDEYVLAGGSWSSSILRGLGLRLPLQPGKGYSLTLDAPVQLPRISYILAEARVAVTPMSGTLRFAGTMELAGLDQTIRPRRIRGITKNIGSYLPAFGPETFKGTLPWCGLRPCSPDGLPYIGRSRRYENLVVATGHAMMGLSLGPITGKLTAEILDEQKHSIDVTLLDVDRYL